MVASGVASPAGAHAVSAAASSRPVETPKQLQLRCVINLATFSEEVAKLQLGQFITPLSINDLRLGGQLRRYPPKVARLDADKVHGHPGFPSPGAGSDQIDPGQVRKARFFLRKQLRGPDIFWHPAPPMRGWRAEWVESRVPASVHLRTFSDSGRGCPASSSQAIIRPLTPLAWKLRGLRTAPRSVWPLGSRRAGGE